MTPHASCLLVCFAGDETYQDIFQDFSHMASNDPDKLNRYQQYDNQRPWRGCGRPEVTVPDSVSLLWLPLTHCGAQWRHRQACVTRSPVAGDFSLLSFSPPRPLHPPPSSFSFSSSPLEKTTSIWSSGARTPTRTSPDRLMVQKPPKGRVTSEKWKDAWTQSECRAALKANSWINFLRRFLKFVSLESLRRQSGEPTVQEFQEFPWFFWFLNKIV